MMEWFNDLCNRVYVTFIFEDRWKFFYEGFLMTLLLTASSFLLGTLLGALLCALKLSRVKFVSKLVGAINGLFIQLPTMVLLMLFVYIIFGETALSVVLIVIIGLTIKTACYMADIFESAVSTVSKGEGEAAMTLGLSRSQAFLHVTLPQAVTAALPLYKNQFVSTLQETSIVGYLAICDLTRASDIVTARTLDAFFGLIVISVLYLIIGWIGTALLNLLQHKKHLGGPAHD